MVRLFVATMGVRGRGDGGGTGISSEHGVLGLASDSLLGSLESLCGLLGGVCEKTEDQQREEGWRRGGRGRGVGRDILKAF